MEKKHYGSILLSQLKDELRKRGAKVSGTKDKLIERLEDYDRNNNFKSQLSVQEEDNISCTIIWPNDNAYCCVNLKTLVPDLDIVNVNAYFFESYMHNAGLTEYTAVHRKSYNMMLNEYLCALNFVMDDSFFYFKGQVQSENTKSLTYLSRIALREDGVIMQSDCECIAGKGPKAVCKHVGVVCYTLLRYREHSEWCIKKTPTEKTQAWHKSKVKFRLSPKKAEDISYKIHEYNVSKKICNDLCYDSQPSSHMPNIEWNDSVKNNVINYCCSDNKVLGINGVLKVGCFKAIVEDHDYLKLPLHYQYILNRITLSLDEVHKLERQTVNQSQNKLWHAERALRITASNVGEICKFSERRNKEQYAENLVDPKCITSEALQYGKTKEKSAIEAYESMSHNKVEQCGLFISTQYPYIGASPDALVGDQGILEVKCPFSIKNQFITPESYSHLEYRDNKICLKESSNYYYQIQTQLLVTERQYADFFIWTMVHEIKIVVNRNDFMINNVIIPRIKDFYFDYMLPVITNKLYGVK